MTDLAAIYEQERAQVFAYVLRRVGNWHVAEDLTSAAFEDALALLPHANPHALLLTLARFRVKRHWKMEHDRKTVCFADVFTAAPLDTYAVLAIDDGMDRVIEACDTAMAAAFLKAALSQCSAADLAIVDLRYVRRLSAKATAAQLGLSPQQFNKKHGSLMQRLAQRLASPEKTRPSCLLCDEKIYGRGVCHYHYQQARDGKRIPMLPPKAEREKPTACQVCGGPHYSRGYCRPHYQQLRTVERRAERLSAGELL